MTLEPVMDNKTNKPLVAYDGRVVMADLDVVEDGIVKLEETAEKYSGGIIGIGELYKAGEEAINQYIQYAACKKGCASCCYLEVAVTRAEYQNIYHYIKGNFTSREIYYIGKNSKINSKKLNRFNNTIEYFNKQIPCIFLGEDNCCRIYKVRPWNCRRHFSVREEIHCKPGGEDTFSVEVVEEIMIKALLHGENDSVSRVKNMNEWFSEGL